MAPVVSMSSSWVGRRGPRSERRHHVSLNGIRKKARFVELAALCAGRCRSPAGLLRVRGAGLGVESLMGSLAHDSAGWSNWARVSR